MPGWTPPPTQPISFRPWQSILRRRKQYPAVLDFFLRHACTCTIADAINDGKSAMDSQARPLPHGLSPSNRPGSVRFLGGIPFLAPPACGWTLTPVLSGISVDLPARSCAIRTERIRSRTPAFVHARNRLYTLGHGPNRSGKSRHGIPVLSRYKVALSLSRLLFPGRLPWGFLSGENRSLILFHRFSRISCRFINPALPF